MSDERDKLNQLSEIIDVEFLPVLDDEDFKREKTSEIEQDEIATVAVQNTPQSVKEIETPQVEEQPKQQEEVKVHNESAYNTYTESKVYTEQKANVNRNYQGEDHTAYQKYTNTNGQAYQQDTAAPRQDTSYASYNSIKKEEFKKKKRKVGSSLLNGILLACAILFGLPIAVTFGGIAIFVLGMGIFFSVFALGMGVLGLGMAGFTATAGMASMGMLCLFGSLIAIGVGGLGCCIMALIFIGIKNLIVGSKQRRKLRKEREEA